MNCQLLREITAWPCRTVTGTNGESAFVVAPPVEFWDGSLVPMYVIDRGESIEITDDGSLLQHLDASGFAVSADGRRKKSLTNALAKWGVALDDELRIGCKPQDLRQAIHRFMGALFSAAHWESENAGKALDSGLLIQEAELLLRAVYPSANVFHDVELRGISGRKQVFPLRFDSTYYDAVGSHPASSASVVKKLVDVRFVRDNTDTQITVIVEDRVNIDRAKADIQIFTQLAHVLRFSELEARAREASQIH